MNARTIWMIALGVQSLVIAWASMRGVRDLVWWLTQICIALTVLGGCVVFGQQVRPIKRPVARLDFDPDRPLATNPQLCTVRAKSSGKRGTPARLTSLVTPAGEMICGAYDIALLRHRGIWVAELKLEVNVDIGGAS